MKSIISSDFMLNLMAYVNLSVSSVMTLFIPSLCLFFPLFMSASVALSLSLALAFCLLVLSDTCVFLRQVV